MGNENNSMCACYDNDAERAHAESDVLYRNSRGQISGKFNKNQSNSVL